MRRDLILVGGGGHCKVVIDAIRAGRSFRPYGIIDPSLSPGSTVMGIRVLGDDKLLARLAAQGIRSAFISIGSIGNCQARKRADTLLRSLGFSLPSITHPAALIGREVRIGEGAFIAARAVINPGVSVGRNAIINTSASVDHDCAIGDFVHIAPGTVLSGGTTIGDETHIGTGARVTQYLRIGKRCIVGAGQTIRHDMEDGEKSYGERCHRAKRGSAVFIIAEAGVNHNGRLDLAKRLIDEAKAAGADAVKFQTFDAERLASARAPKAAYQRKALPAREGQRAMLRRLELGPAGTKAVMEHCRRKKITFLSSPFDVESIRLLDGLGLTTFKIPSGEITNLPYLRVLGRLRKKIIMSTGMADMTEVKNALMALQEAGTPKENITLLHCSSEYPAPAESANLMAMLTMRKAFRVQTGYSDHTRGCEIAIAAAALGASVVEKHFTLDRTMAGPDHRASLEPHELKAMVSAIRNVEKAIGSGIKRPGRGEMANRHAVRKSIVASRAIRKGDILTEASLTTKRPAAGISPMRWNDVVGRKARRDFRMDEAITL